jgi:hypothetical protein
MDHVALPVPDLDFLSHTLDVPMVVLPGAVDINVRESSQMMYMLEWVKGVHSLYLDIHWSHWPHLHGFLLKHSLLL